MSRVMVVDDEPDVLDTLGTILSLAGHSVIKVHNGIEALDVLDRGEPLDLLLTDVIMPGLNGFNLARMAKTRRPTLKVLYLTGYSQRADVTLDQGEKYGKLLTKPILPDDLRREVSEVLAAVRAHRR